MVFDDRLVEAAPVNLVVLALPGIDPTYFNAVVASEDFGGLTLTEDPRMVVIDPMIGVPGLANSCPTCAGDGCTTGVHLVIDGAASPVAAFFDDASLYTCVFHPEELEPRFRMLVLSPTSFLDPIFAEALSVVIAEGQWDLDLACPGCDENSPDFAATVVAAGGFVSNLDDEESIGTAAFLAAARPPRCGWAVDDPIEAPLGLADLQVTVDVCGSPAPCPEVMSQVSGPGVCDADDPSASEFWVLADGLGPGVSLASLCPPACERQSRLPALFYSVTHTYTCPG